MTRFESIAPGVGLFRFYKEQSADPMATYCGVCTAVFNAHDLSVDLKGMHGSIHLDHLVDMARHLNQRGVATVRAVRSRGRRLPLFRHDGDQQQTQVADWIARFGAS